MSKKISFGLTFLVTILLGACTAQETTRSTESYEWNDYGITIFYPSTYRTYPLGINGLYLSEEKPAKIDMDFIYSALVVYEDTTVEERTEEIKEAERYRTVEVIGPQSFGENQYTLVHIHSSTFGETDTNFFLMPFDNNTLEFEAGIYDYKMVNSFLSSIEIE